MTTTEVVIGISAPVITFLIGRYFKSVKIKELEKLSFKKGSIIDRLTIDLNNAYQQNEDLLNQEREILRQHFKISLACEKMVQLVPNKNPHQAADKEYIAVYPNNGIEPAHFTREEYQKGVDRLKEHPEDKTN